MKVDPQTGEILVPGESVARSYWQGRELKPVAADEGWFRTGDLGAMDDEGNLYFKGRQKNVIVNPEGLNIYPDDLEAALKRDAAVRDAVVVGLERGGNAEPVAVLLLRHDAGAEEIVRRANQQLAEFQHMRRWLGGAGGRARPCLRLPPNKKRGGRAARLHTNLTLRVSALGAALADHLAAHLYLLPADLSLHHGDGAAARSRARTFARRGWAAALRQQSRRLH